MVILSLCSGSYFSKPLGVSILGKLTNFKFPLPETSTFIWADSLAFNSSLLVVTLKSKSPTAPEKSTGLFCSGKGFTFTIRFPVVSVKVVLFEIIFPNKSLLPMGIPAVISISMGSILNFPDF